MKSIIASKKSFYVFVIIILVSIMIGELMITSCGKKETEIGQTLSSFESFCQTRQMDSTIAFSDGTILWPEFEIMILSKEDVDEREYLDQQPSRLYSFFINGEDTLIFYYTPGPFTLEEAHYRNDSVIIRWEFADSLRIEWWVDDVKKDDISSTTCTGDVLSVYFRSDKTFTIFERDFPTTKVEEISRNLKNNSTSGIKSKYLEDWSYMDRKDHYEMKPLVDSLFQREGREIKKLTNLLVEKTK